MTARPLARLFRPVRAALFALAAGVPIVAATSGFPQNLPDLGDVSQATMSTQMERRLGESIMREIRADRRYRDDAEVTDYLGRLGARLVSSSPDARQGFEFFFIDDPTVNAFALPGGFIGVHAGLILTAQTESELAAVLAHEIAHVTQRHIARIVDAQSRTQIASLAALALAILAARSNAQVSQALIAGSQAAGIQSLLDFTREHEREADRIGLQILEKAGFDVRSMPSLFERMQRANRFYDTNAQSYLRTHPLTFERIADVQNRIHDIAYRQVPDNPEYQMVRAKLRSEADAPRDTVAFFDDLIRERKYASEAAARYGLVLALMRAKDLSRARAEFATLKAAMPANAMVDLLGVRIVLAADGRRAGLDAFRRALADHPRHRPLVYEYADALLAEGDAAAALRIVDDQQQFQPGDVRLYLLQARAYAQQGKRFLQHRAQGEAYARQGNVPGAIEQLQLAQRAGDADFFQGSAVDARLRELKQIEAETRKKP